MCCAGIMAQVFSRWPSELVHSGVHQHVWLLCCAEQEGKEARPAPQPKASVARALSQKEPRLWEGKARAPSRRG